MTLLETQRKMMAALMVPLTSEERLASKTKSGKAMAQEAASFIKPNSRLTSMERLEIYSRSYWARLLDSLRDDFPGLVAVLGSDSFDRLARGYLTDCPSESFTLRDLGSHLEWWLREHPGYAGKQLGLSLDMVRLEWAHIVAFDGPADKILGPEDLIELTPALRAGLQPYISLLDLHYPVDELRVRVNADPQGPETSSNVALKKGRHSRRLMKGIQPQSIFLVVHRLDWSVYYRRVSAQEFRLLQALRAGRTVRAAIEVALRDSAICADEIPGLLKTWFAAWAEFGWLSAPRGVRRKAFR